MAQIIGPQDFGDVGHAHGHAWMATFGFLHRVHTECADRVSLGAPIHR